MSCYYHPKVPTAIACRDCGKEICTSCSQDDVCPGCRLGRALNATVLNRRPIAGTANGNGANGNGARSAFATSTAAQTVDAAPAAEDRTLAAICYPLWPVALLMLVLPSHRSKFVRFNVLQALGVNALGVALYVAYALSANLPVIGWQSALMVPFLVPAWLLVDLYLAVRAFGGHLTRVPIAAEFAQRFAG
jgi:uncharacterized membrane protein